MLWVCGSECAGGEGWGWVMDKCVMGHDELGKALVAWITVPEHYNLLHFCSEAGLSKERLFRMAGESSVLQEALDYAMTVMEWKLSDGALQGNLDRVSAMKMLETYNGWKSDVAIVQRNEFKQFMNEAKVKAEQILSRSRSGHDAVEAE